MNKLERLIGEISDENLREQIKTEIDNLTKTFGLVFESKDEFFPRNDLPVKKNSLVAKIGKLDETFIVTEIDGDKIFCSRDEKTFEFTRDEIICVNRLGSPIYPGLTKLDEICNAPNSELWHLLIEAENYHALQLLKYPFAGKVDCIYIDPPYNTGARDWKYNDAFVDAADRYNHSKWLAMMERRLLLAKELLSDSGAIFISIDDNEACALKLLCDKIFGMKNFIDIFSWKKTETPANLSLKTKKAVEYILCYTKTTNSLKFRGLKKASKSSNGLMNQTNSAKELLFPSDYVDTALADGIYIKGEYGTAAYKIFLLDNTEVRNGVFIKPVRLHGKFKWSQKKLDEEISQGTKISIRTKAFSPSYERAEYEPEVPWNIIDKTFGVQTNEHASAELKKLFGGQKVFDFPKPHSLIEYLINFLCDKNSLILDFFAGSGTTLHAVNLLNATDGGNRRCILVTNNEGDIARSVTWQRTVCSIEGHDINGTPLNGNYLGTELAMSDGFKSNAAFFALNYLDKNSVELGEQFNQTLPVLWLKAGGIGRCPTFDEETLPPYKIFAENKFAVLFNESHFAEFQAELDGAQIETFFAVTGSDNALNLMAQKLRVAKSFRLYEDYLENFKLEEVTR